MPDTIGLIVFPHDSISDSVLEACSFNFSNYYGKWQEESRGRVKMTKAALVRSFLGDNGQLVIAFDATPENIIGHAFFKVFHSDTIQRMVSWITQLVVRKEYRLQKIAQRMLSAAIPPTVGCAGLATTHPYAVMALERAMRKKVDPAVCKLVAAKIIMESNIGYSKDCPLVLDGEYCLVNTSFYVDHAEPEAGLAALQPGSWSLGGLVDGHEFIAIILA